MATETTMLRCKMNNKRVDKRETKRESMRMEMMKTSWMPQRIHATQTLMCRAQ